MDKNPIITEYCKRFETLGNTALARLIIRDFPELYDNEENVRKLVRVRRGASGDFHRKNNTTFKDIYKPIGWQKELPKAILNEAATWKLPKAVKRVLLLSDIHIPFHDEKSLQTALEHGKYHDVDAIFLNGDTLDFYQLSSHEKDIRLVDFATEIEQGKQFLEYLRSNFDCPIYWIDGNHEQRLQRYLMSKAPELIGVPEFKISVLLQFGRFGITEIPYGSKVYFGKLLVEHGDKLRGAGGVQPARTLLMKFKRPVICGHFHRHSEATDRIYDGDLRKAWSLGCLCELEPKYMPVNDWSHGAAIIEINHDTGEFYVNNFQIINGKIY